MTEKNFILKAMDRFATAFAGTGSSNPQILQGNQQSFSANNYPVYSTQYTQFQGQENDTIRKGVVTQWLWNPIFGQPRAVNLIELRDWANTEFVRICIDTLIEEVVSIPWTVRMKEGYDENRTKIDEIDNFLRHPNANNESLQQLLRAFVRDLLELDSGVIIKNFSPSGELKEIWARDGGTFLKNFDMHGVKPGVEDVDVNGNRIPAFFQYSFIAPTMKPIPFFSDEVIYASMHPKSYSIYGQSTIEVIKDRVLTYLFRSTQYNADYFRKNAIPNGILFMKDVEPDAFTRFKQYWEEKIKGQDHSMPIVEGEGDFKVFSMSNKEMEFIQGQQWFANIVFSAFKLNPNELGFTGTVGSKNIGESQERITIKKAIKPMLDVIEWHFNNEILPEFYKKGEVITREDILNTDTEFMFDDKDSMADEKQLARDTVELDKGKITINELRVRDGQEEVWWGDEPLSMSSGFNMGAIPGDDELQRTFIKPGATEEDFEDEEAFELFREKYKDVFFREKYKDVDDLINVKINKEVENITGKKYVPKQAFYDQPEMKMSMIQAEKTMEKIYLKMITELKREVISEIKANKHLYNEMKTKGLLDNFKFLNEKISEIFNFVFGKNKAQIEAMVTMSYDAGQEQVEKTLDANIPISKNSIDIIEVAKENTVVHIKADLDDYKKDITEALTDGVTNRKSITAISKEIGKRTNVAKSRAKAIARTETNRIFNQAHLNTYKDSDMVIGKQWVTAEDDRVRPAHKKLDGKKVELDDTFHVDGVGDVQAPPGGVNCRCSIIPVLKGEKL